MQAVDISTAPFILLFGAGVGSDQLTQAMPVALKRSLGLRSPVSIRQVRDVGGLTDFLAARPDGDKLTEHIDDAATYYAPGVIKG